MYIWAFLVGQIVWVSTLYSAQCTQFGMIEALIYFHYNFIRFGCAITFSTANGCGFYAFYMGKTKMVMNCTGKCTAHCISTHAFAHTLQIDIWSHLTIKNYHSSSILFRNCIAFWTQKHVKR